MLGGEFSYEGSPLKSRHTVARVAWIDPQNSYQQAVEVVEDFDAVVSQGQIPVDIVAFGCTSRGLAHRWGKWMLDTEKNQTELMSCGVGLEQLRSRPGDVVRVADPALAGVRMGGRTAPGSTTHVVYLDQLITPAAGLSYYLSVVLPDGSVSDKIGIGDWVTSNSLTGVQLQANLPLAPDVNASWVISSYGPSGLLPVDTRQFRVLALSEPHRGQFQMSALIHDPNKYARVEYGIQFDPTPYSTLAALLVEPLPPPANVSARDYMIGVGTTTVVRVTVGFTPANDVRVVQTQIHCDGPEQRDVSVDGSTVDIDSLQLGEYVFRARSVGKDGRTSIWVDSPQVNVDGMADPPDPPTAFTAIGGAMQIRLTWTNSVARDIRHYELWRAPASANGTHPFPFGGYTPTGTPANNGASLLTTVAASSFLDSGDTLRPDTAWAYWIRAINTTGGQSNFAGPIKGLTTYYITDNLEQGIQNTAPIAYALLGSAPLALANLSTPGGFDGQLALNASDSKLYRWVASANSGNGAWQLYVALTPDQNGQIAAAKLSGSFTSTQAAAIVAAIGNGSITDSMIASLAGSKVSGQLSNATMQAGQIYDVDPVTGLAVVGVDTTKLLGQIGTTQITDGGITTPKIGAGAVVANSIAAGAITGNKLSIAGPGNVIGNPCCPSTAWGWVLSYSGGSLGSVLLGSVTGDGYAPSSYALAGEGSGVITASGSFSGSDVISAYWDPDGIGGVQCAPGDWWEAQAYLGCQRCYGDVAILFYNGSGTLLTSTYSGRDAGSVGGATLSTYGFTWTKAQAPAGAARVRMLISGFNDAGGDIAGGTAGSNPFVFFTHAVLAPSTSVALSLATPQPYTIGGVTQVVGGAIKTGSIVARNISAGAIDATKLSVGSVSSVITNSCCTVASTGWYSGGAVSSVLLSSSWSLAGYGTGQIAASLAASATIDTSWAPDGAPYAPGGQTVPWAAAVACNPGDVWEGQAQVITNLCSCELFVAFLAQADSDGTWQIAGTTSTGAQAWAVPSDGRSLGKYHRLYVRGTCPGAGTYNGKVCSRGATLVTLILRAGNTAASQAVFGSGTRNAILYFTQTALGIAQTSSAPMTWSPGGSTQVDGGTIRTGSIIAGTLAAGAVTAGSIAAGTIGANEIAAGSIVASKLAVGSATNLIWNATPDQTLDGWTYHIIGLSGYFGDGNNYGDIAANIAPSFALAGAGSGIVSYGSGPVYTTQGYAVDWNPQGLSYASGVGAGVPARSGETYGGAAYVISANSAAVSIQLIFFDYTMNVLSLNISDTVSNNSTGYGLILDQYTRLTVIGTAPVNAAFVLFRIVLAGTSAGANAPFLAYTRAQLGQLPTGATTVGDWQPGGVTTLSGGMIKTNTLNANRIVAGSITADKIAANTISADKLLANSITAGQIQAGAIGASQIAAGQIRATHLAADFVLASSAQIGTAVIQSAQIGDLQVGTSKVAYGGVTTLGQSFNYPNTAATSSFTAYAQVNVVINDDNNRGVMLSFTFTSDVGGTQQGQLVAPSGDSGGGGEYYNVWSSGNAILLRHYQSNGTYGDVLPYTGAAVSVATGTFILGALGVGTHSFVLYAIASGSAGTTIHSANIAVISFDR